MNITEKDRDEANKFCEGVQVPATVKICGKVIKEQTFTPLNTPENIEKMAGYIARIRAESAEQARKEAAVRAVAFIDNNYNFYGEWDRVAFDDLRATILGVSR